MKKISKKEFIARVESHNAAIIWHRFFVPDTEELLKQGLQVVQEAAAKYEIPQSRYIDYKHYFKILASWDKKDVVYESWMFGHHYNQITDPKMKNTIYEISKGFYLVIRGYKDCNRRLGDWHLYHVF